MKRRFADLFPLPPASLAALCSIASLALACSSEPEDADVSGGATGAGGAQTSSGGDTGAGGNTSSAGGAASGGASSGGAANAAGGALGSGGAGTGGDANGTGGDAAGGADSETGGSDGAGGDGSGGSEGGGEFTLTSPAWTVLDNEACTEVSDVSECGAFPKENLSDGIGGGNLSPELNWTDPPEGTMGFAIVLHDLNYTYVHWAVWNIGPDVRQLSASLPSGAISDPAGAEQGSISGGGYFGSGKCGNTYEFRLYALSDAAYAPPGGNITTFRDDLVTAPEVLGTSFARLRSGPPDCN